MNNTIILKNQEFVLNNEILKKSIKIFGKCCKILKKFAKNFQKMMTSSPAQTPLPPRHHLETPFPQS